MRTLVKIPAPPSGELYAAQSMIVQPATLIALIRNSTNSAKEGTAAQKASESESMILSYRRCPKVVSRKGLRPKNVTVTSSTNSAMERTCRSKSKQTENMTLPKRRHPTWAVDGTMTPNVASNLLLGKQVNKKSDDDETRAPRMGCTMGRRPPKFP